MASSTREGSSSSQSVSNECSRPVVNVRTSGDNPMTTLKAVLEEIQFKPVGFSSTNISLLVVGRTGKGKSTFINSIIEFKKQIAEEAPDDTGTMNVQCYMCEDVIPGVNVTLIDSPGLGDIRGLEHKYLQDIKEQCPEISLVLYCIDMNDRRSENDALETMKKLHRSFGSEFWKRVVFILTFANNVDCEEIDTNVDASCNDDDLAAREDVEELPDDGDDEAWKKLIKKRFLRKLNSRSNKIKSTLKSILDESDHKLVDEIQVVPVGSYKRKRGQPNHLQLPCTDNWLFDVLKLCCVQIKEKHKYSILTLNDKIHFAIIIDNVNDQEFVPTQQSHNLNPQAKATKQTLESLGFSVLYFNKLNSVCIIQLLEAFKSAANNSQLAAFALVIFSKAGTRHIYASDGIAVSFQQIFSSCAVGEQLASIPKLFFLLLSYSSK